jgi:transcriptional regulator with XRE-family HTH domain
MNADRFRYCLRQLDWTLHGLARVLDLNFSTAQRWASGQKVVPAGVAQWLETLAKIHADNPPPVAPRH